ncbi:MAG TPA: hypothetical protein VNW92_21555 [Polyangiaceae bacterium]|jgi:hypothetical protein|nr:hypothetical protein [Polyangiaceae bacterium]
MQATDVTRAGASGGTGLVGGGGATATRGGSDQGGSSAIAIAGTGTDNSEAAGAAGASPSSSAGGSSGGPGFGGASGGHAGVETAGASGSGTAGSVTGGLGGATTGGSSGMPGVELIDDFEDQDLLVLLVNKRNGPWYAFHDATATGVQTFGIGLLTGTNARPGSTAALHMTASGFTDYGAGFGADFVNMQAKKVPYDVSAYSGIRFYAKVASGTQASLKLLIPTTYSDPMGGKCDDSVALKKCNDHLYYPVTALKTTWDVYECDFSGLIQQGFGLPQASLDPTSVYSVQFTLLTKLLPADIWIDDVAFVLK